MTVNQFPRRCRPLPEVPPLVLLDRRLCELEDCIVMARGWAKRTRGADRARYERDIAEMCRELVGLERERLKITGPELALLDGGAK